MPSSSVFHRSLFYTQYSMWMGCDHTFLHCWKHLTLLINWHQQISTQAESSRPQLTRSWTHISRALANKGSKYIEFSNQTNSFTSASGSLGNRFNRNFLTSWRLCTQWGPLPPKEGGLIKVDIGGQRPIPPRPQVSFICFLFHFSIYYF